VASSRGYQPVIRIATAGDVRALAWLRREWIREQAGEVGDGTPGSDDPGFEQRFADWFATEALRRVTWLAEIGGQAVGMVNLAIFERMPSPGRPPSRWGYLGNAYVRAGYRDRGIGAALLAALLAHADANRLARVVLSPSPRSVPLYRRSGFGPADMLLARPLPPGAV
jgi:GNAT superfamily N-acetyltransferase